MNITLNCKQINRTENVTPFGSFTDNFTWLYLGNKGNRVYSKIGGSVVFSVPCDLKASTQEGVFTL